MPRKHGSTEMHRKENAPIPEELNVLSGEIVDAAYKVHYQLGPGLLERIYEVCLCHELEKKGLFFERQLIVPIYYDDIYFEEGLRLDVMVENRIICELKALETVNPIWEAQLLSQLNLPGKDLDY